jgi:hypothetical protein
MAKGLCARCKEEPVYVTEGGSVSGYCLSCRREHSQVLYLIKKAHPYAEVLASQDGVCLLCREPPGEDETFHYDHDHETGQFRGLVCHLCNLGLGYFRDRIDLLERAIVYLEDSNRLKHYMKGIVNEKSADPWDYLTSVGKKSSRHAMYQYKHRRNKSS